MTTLSVKQDGKSSFSRVAFFSEESLNMLEKKIDAGAQIAVLGTEYKLFCTSSKTGRFISLNFSSESDLSLLPPLCDMLYRRTENLDFEVFVL